MDPKRIDAVNVVRREVEISGGRILNSYTFELDGKPMPEMGKDDIVSPLGAFQPSTK
jgi:hypothetical protein